MATGIWTIIAIIIVRWLFIKYISEKESIPYQEPGLNKEIEEVKAEEVFDKREDITGLTQRHIVAYLQGNGYTIEIDGVFVNFKYEGDWYYIAFDESQDAIYGVTGKYYYSFENSPEINQEFARRAVEIVSKQLKFVKAYCDDSHIYLRMEQPYESIVAFANFFHRSISALQHADHTFREEYDKLSESNISGIEKYSAAKTIRQNEVVN